MNIKFMYSPVYDLIYHILAHLKVENDSCLYSVEYISQINEAKNGNYNNIEAVVSDLSEYYNLNFDRLCLINFVPFYCSSLEEFVKFLNEYNDFTPTDRDNFVSLFCEIIKREQEFYEDFWNCLYNLTHENRSEVEKYIESELSKYEVLFTYFNRKSIVALSYALTRNGRGFGSDNAFNAAVPFPMEQSRYKETFYQILHEYTHQFTDRIIESDINMNDGSHDLSERIVIVFDYYLIKLMYPNEIDEYIRWINKTENIENCDENSFLSFFKINDSINSKLFDLARIIAEL